jgi:signal peptidase II
VVTLPNPAQLGKILKTDKRNLALQNDKSNKNPLTNRLIRLMALLAIGATIFIADQVTKTLVAQNLALYESWEPIPTIGRIFKITHILNTGAAFGLFPQGGNFFMIVAIIVAFAIVYYVSFYPAMPGLVQTSLGLQLGGAVGNLWDRIQHGSVIDFVDIGFWPIFNIADISIVLGVLILAFWLWQEEEKEQKAAASSVHPHLSNR